MLTMDQVWTLVRQMLLTLGGVLVTRGYIDSATLQLVVGAILTLLTSAYGLWLRRKAGLIASAAALPEVSRIVTTTALARVIPDPTVTDR